MRAPLSWTLHATALLCILLTGCGSGTNQGNGPQPHARLSVTSVSPTTVPAGSSSVGLTVTGTGFDSTDTLSINNTSVPVTLVSSSQLMASVSASLLANGGLLSIVVTDGSGSTSGGGAGAVSLEVDNPAPVLTAATPQTLPLAAGAPTITFAGTGFVPSTTIQVGGSARPTTFLSATQVSATLTPADTAVASPLAITASNPAPAGGVSAALSVPVLNPAPGAITLSPTSVVAGTGAATAITVNGSGFVPGAVARVNGSLRPSTVISATQLSFQLTPADQLAAATLSIDVFNPAPGGGASPASSLLVANPLPAISGVSPNGILVGSTTPGTILLMGSNFVAGSVAQINGSARPTSVSSSAQLSFQLTPADRTTTGTLAVSVDNPAPGGGVSASADLLVSNPVPGQLTLAPASVSAGGTTALSVTVNGTNFLPGSVVQVNGNPRATAYTSATQLGFQLTAVDQATAGSLAVTVVNAAPGGGASPAASFTVTQAVPTLTSLTPASVNLGSSDVAVTIAGTNFTSTCVGILNGQPLLSSVTSSGSLQVTLPASLLSSVASFTLSVRDTASALASTKNLPFTVVNPVPVVTQFTPSSVAEHSPDTVLVLTGANFNRFTTVLLGATALPTTFISSTKISVIIPAASLIGYGALNLTVSNPAPQGGSITVALPVGGPAPVLLSVSPASVLVNSAGTLVTITGQNFTPHSFISAPGFSPATTYISPTTLQFTMSSNYTGQPGNRTIQVADPSAVDFSNQLTLQVLNPQPVLNTISPATVTAGAPSFQLTLAGSGFLTYPAASQVFINGIAHPTDYNQTPNAVTVIVDASEVSNVGSLAVTVVNAGPGGGTSNSIPLQVISANNRVRTIGAAATALGWDATHHLLLATTSSSSAINPNSLIAIDPLQGTVVAAQTLPVQPDGLSITDDNTYAYVSLPSSGQIERLLLPSLQPDITFSLGTETPGYPWCAESLVAAPGHPHTVAVNRKAQGSTYDATGGVVIYDDGVPRPSIATPSGFNGSYNGLVWGADDTTLYASNGLISTAEEDIFNVSQQGVTLVSANTGVLNQFVKQMAFDASSHHLVDDNGGVTDAQTGASVGQMASAGPIPFISAASFALDAVQRRVYYMRSGPSSQYGSDLGIEAFDLDRYRYLNSIVVQGLNSFASLARWGTSGLAVSSLSQIFLIDGSFVSPAGVSAATGSYAATSPTLLSVTPAAVPAGSPDTQLTLTGKDFSLANVITWNDQTFAPDAATDTQLTITIPAAMLASPAAGAVTVSNGFGTLSGPSMSFSVLPDLGPTAQLSMLELTGADAAWDSAHNLLYVAVPTSDPVFPDSIAVVDPAAGALRRVVPVLNHLGVLSISSDNAYLYAGFSANPVVQRYTLPDLAVDLNIPLGSPAISFGTPVGGRQTCTFAMEVKAAPGNSHTVAIDQGSVYLEPRGCGALTIYDDAVQRPNALSWSNRGDQSSVAWGIDPNTLFGLGDACCSSQGLSEIAVSSAGLSYQQSLASGGGLGLRVHFDPGTGYVFTDSGVITNPANATRVGTLTPGPNPFYPPFPVLTLPDPTNNLVYLLVRNSGSSSNGATDYQLAIFNKNNLSLITTLLLPNLLGDPSQMVRWGTNGIAITTASTDGVGALYLLQGSAFTSP